MARLTKAEIARIRRLHSNALKRAVLSSFTNIKNEAVLGDLVDRIDAGDIEGAIEVINLQRAKFASMEQAIIDAYSTGGGRTADFIGRLDNGKSQVMFSFDARAPRAEEWLRDRSGTLVREIIADQQSMIRAALTKGMEVGDNPRSTALDIIGRVDRLTKRRTGGTVGLTQHQYGYVQNMRDDLISLDDRYFTRKLRDRRFDGVVRRAIEEGKRLTDRQIMTIEAHYKDALLNMRGEAIGRTESLNALRAGQHESVMQAMEVEGVERSEAKKRWSSSGNDGRTRRDHLRMDGQVVRVDMPFIAPDGSKLMYPGDSSMGADADQIIQCRCSSRIEVDFIRHAVRLEGF